MSDLMSRIADDKAEKLAALKNADREEKIPMCGSKDESDYTDRMSTYHDLVGRRDELIASGISAYRLLVPIKPVRQGATTALPYKSNTNLARCQKNQDEQEAIAKVNARAEAGEPLTAEQFEHAALHASDPPRLTIPGVPERFVAKKTANPMMFHTGGALRNPNDLDLSREQAAEITRAKIDAMTEAEISQEIGVSNPEILTTKEEAYLIAKDILTKVANPLLSVGTTRPLPHGPIVKPVADYIWDGAEGGKDSNPKEAFGTRKAGLSCIPTQVKYELGLAMLEGALKYGRHNYRVAGVRASTYYDACGRHMDDWWEGEDLDPKSGAKLHHIVKAMAGLAVIRDSIIAGNWTDDRPPRIGNPQWLDWYNKQAEIMVEACKNPKPPYTELEHGKCGK